MNSSKPAWCVSGVRASRLQLRTDIDLARSSQDKTKAAHQKTDEAHIRRALLTTRSESLSLYRAVIRASVFFVWRDDRGRVWRDVIRDSARQEFDVGRHERDPEMVNRMLLTGRDALDRTVGKFLERRATIQKEEDRSRDAGRDRAGARASDLRDPPLT